MHSKTCSLPFLALFLIFLIAGANSKEWNSDDPANYWRTVTNNQPLPEALQALLKEDRAPEKTEDHLRGKFEKDSKVVSIQYLRYKKDNQLNDVDPEVSGNHLTKTFKKDPNSVHLSYLQYKKDSDQLNNIDPKVSGNDHFTTTFQEDPNVMHLSYLRYKKDNQLKDVDPEVPRNHLTKTFQKDPNGVHLSYLQYKKDGGQLNNVDPKVSGNHLTKTFQKDPNGVHLSYLQYKKDNDRLNNVDPKISGNDHFTTTFQEDPNGMHLGYLRYKKNNQLNDVDPEVPGNHLTKTFQKYPNRVHLSYLQYKKDSDRLNNVDPKVSGNDHFTTTFQDDPNKMHLNYLRYKKDNQLKAVDPEMSGNHLTKAFQKDPNGVHFNYLRYKKDGGRLNNVDPKVLGNQLNNADPDVSGDHFTKKFRNDPSGRLFLRYKKDSRLNKADPEVPGDHFTQAFPNDPNSHHLNYYRYKKDDQLDKVEYAKLLVFTPADLYVGMKFLTMFPYVSTSSSDSHFASPKFLPRHVADSLPFASAHLPDILRRFGIQPDSPWVELIEETLKDCEAPRIMGETIFCATSLESMLDSARDTFGSNYDTKVISTTHLSETSNDGSTDPRPQKYTLIEAPKEIQAAKKMSCHPMPYLYPVFGCHIVKDSKLFRLLLEGEDGSKVDALAVCHMDTSDWSPGAPFLQAAGLKPGEGAVCHFLQPNHLAIFASSIGVAAAL